MSSGFDRKGNTMSSKWKSFKSLRSINLIFFILLCSTIITVTSCGGGGGGNGSEANNSDTSNSDTGSNASNPWAPRFNELAETLQEGLENSTAYGVSVAVMENGAVTFAQAFGNKDQNSQIPLTPDTLMQIGSTTKQMTAVFLLQKVEADQVSISDTLETVLPFFEFELDGTWDDQITIHHLLSQQTGITDGVSWEGSMDTELADWTYDVFDEEYYLMNPPGIFWNYSNPNYALAGLVVEELDDRFWPDIMREDIFLPLGMDRTFSRKSEVEDDGDFAISYGRGVGTDGLPTPDKGPVEMAFMWDAAWSRPQGLIWTTPTQMMLWAEFLMHGDTNVLSDELRTEVTAKQIRTLPFEGSDYYGYGMFINEGFLTQDGSYYETPIWQHAGGTFSFTHNFYILPDYDFAISICASGYLVFEDFKNSLDTAITTLADLPPASPAPAYEFSPEKLDNHVGTYIISPPAPSANEMSQIFITRNGDSLYFDNPTLTQEGIDYTPELETVSSNIFMYYVDGEAYDLTFIPEEEGGVSKYIRNRYFVGTRLD